MVSSQPTVVHDGQAPTGPYIKRITNDDREDEMEKNMNQMGNHIKILKNMALDFGDRIDDHNKIIDDVNDKTATTKSEVAAAEKQARKHH
ncbi:synaptosomal-associated protein 23-like [Sinocyclocheilus grahami]|uniref:synaptosomal-associated protein 23-like n=1 Tax=Sinocyclocheilus grahami TaxID=75366 RepID=UPI0007ACB6D1|nr:PREDICTED: synaptosomal-associated protein 23-like [Sinocyclocheilus grahami]